MKHPIEPRQPYPPTEPQEYYDAYQELAPNDYNPISLLDLIAKLPKGVTIKDLEVHSRSIDYGCCGSTGSDEVISINYVVKTKNPSYAFLKKEYKKNLKNYQDKLKVYNLALETYNKDMEAYNKLAEASEFKSLKKRLAILERKNASEKISS